MRRKQFSVIYDLIHQIGRWAPERIVIGDGKAFWQDGTQCSIGQSLKQT